MNADRLCARLDERLDAVITREERLGEAAVLLAEVFRVRPEEVAVFERTRLLDQEVLRFLWPAHLARAASGYVPLSSGHSLAVRTFLESRPFLNLTFASTHHASYFELLPVDRESGRRAPPIQKIISAPARRDGGFQGVVQVCHRGESPDAGPDFGEADLAVLVQLAALLADRL